MRLNEIEQDLPDNVLQAFLKLGNNQRGVPEQAMLKVQNLMGGGILNPVVEHVGDLTHRMTHMLKYGSDKTGIDMILDKCKKVLRYLTNHYGFEKEFNENIKNNFNYFNEKYPNRFKTIDDYKSKIYSALTNYANEHAKLTVYNKAQWLARESAVAIGNQEWDKAIGYLENLYSIAQNEEEFNRAAIEYNLDNNGNLIPFNKINEDLNPGQKDKLQINYDKDKIKKILIDNCSEFLSVLKKTDKLLYRGVKSQAPEVFRGRSRINRKPKDNTASFHNIISALMKEENIKATRNNSIFTSTSSYDANKYGEVYIIFPINGFDFSWSLKYPDLVYDEISDNDIIFKKLNKIKNKLASLYKDEDEFSNKWFFLKANSEDDPQKFIDDINDLLNSNYSIIDIIDKNKTLKNLGIVDTGLQQALEKEHEILINGEYLAFAVAYEELLEELLYEIIQEL